MRLQDINLQTMLTDLVDPQIDITVKTTKKQVTRVDANYEKSKPSVAMRVRVRIIPLNNAKAEQYREAMPLFKFGRYGRWIEAAIIKELEPYKGYDVPENPNSVAKRDVTRQKLANFVCDGGWKIIPTTTDSGIKELHGELRDGLRDFIRHKWPSTTDLIADVFKMFSNNSADEVSEEDDNDD